MLTVFTAAVLTVTGAVCVIAPVGSWWMVGFAFAVHVGVTAVVMVTILRVMDGRTPLVRGRDRSSSSADRRSERRPHTGVEVVPAP